MTPITSVQEDWDHLSISVCWTPIPQLSSPHFCFYLAFSSLSWAKTFNSTFWGRGMGWGSPSSSVDFFYGCWVPWQERWRNLRTGSLVVAVLVLREEGKANWLVWESIRSPGLISICCMQLSCRVGTICLRIALLPLLETSDQSGSWEAKLPEKLGKSNKCLSGLKIIRSSFLPLWVKVAERE